MSEDDGNIHSIEIEAEDSEELESAIQEALEVVDRVREEGGGEDDGGGEPLARAEPEEAMRAELANSQDRLLRTLADFDNFRKRTERERVEAARYEGFGVLRDLLGVVDNLERALAAGGSADDLKVGVEMILKQLHELLARRGVERVAAVGEPFDPRLHDAISRREDPAVSEPTVGEELEAGYSMHDRLLRPARVTVVMPGAVEEEDSAAVD